MAMTVTATQTASTANGMLLRVFVLTGAAAVASQTGASVNTAFLSNTNTWTLSITTTAGSNVYGAATPSPSGVTQTGSNATPVDTVSDTTNGTTYCSFKALNVTSGATARGFTCGGAAGALALQEILASGTLAEDASSPAAASTTTAITVTTASFTPPSGSLLVAIVSTDGTTGSVTVSLSDNAGGLNWTQKAFNNTAAADYAGVWIADAPASGVSGTAAIAGAGTLAASGTSSAPGSGPRVFPGMTSRPAVVTAFTGRMGAARSR